MHCVKINRSNIGNKRAINDIEYCLLSIYILFRGGFFFFFFFPALEINESVDPSGSWFRLVLVDLVTYVPCPSLSLEASTTQYHEHCG